MSTAPIFARDRSAIFSITSFRSCTRITWWCQGHQNCIPTTTDPDPGESGRKNPWLARPRHEISGLWEATIVLRTGTLRPRPSERSWVQPKRPARSMIPGSKATQKSSSARPGKGTTWRMGARRSRRKNPVDLRR
ncbi:MAG: hypothetical protein BJ554DRAFT_1593 [Olpidium bornovanus]|uniref:Uncharacterized protein n=1 Tax=Olpidium bornovanus TaxID=278681 RepID=A0A8H8DHC9_9FUNG|nr:MAG: hypothetical protein BJ554DRAFT_1593 [Olpidium bornovanus]